MRNSVKNPRFPGYPGAKVRHQQSLGTNLVVGEDPGNKVDWVLLSERSLYSSNRNIDDL